MKNKLLIVFSVTVGLFLVSGSLFAHHSASVYDRTLMVTITGTVTRFAFINPHQRIYLNVEDDKGNVVEWIALDGPPRAMRRWGWHKNFIKVGEQLTISGFQYRDGGSNMLEVKVLRANGEDLRTTDTSARFYREFVEEHGGDPARFLKHGKQP